MSSRCRAQAVLVVVLALGAPALSLAVPAAPDVVEERQPDGSTFRARLWGDERSHGWQTDQGFTILRDRTTGYWHFARRGGTGRLERAPERPGIEAPPRGLGRGLRSSRASAPASGLQAAPAEGSAPESAPPRMGTAYVPVLLVNFSDRTTSFTASNFNALLFGSGNNSMRDYYTEVSYGQFTVAAGPSGVAGWYTALNPHDYYGTNDGGVDGTGTDGQDSWPGDLVYEAASAANAAGYNFAPYDQDGDCRVDNIVIVHQGGGEEFFGASAANTWSHSWSLTGAYNTRPSYKPDGYSHNPAFTTDSTCTANPTRKVVVDKYTIQPELYGMSTRISTVGVFAHEYGHALGLPDLYDTDGTSEGVGKWCLMAGGSWNSTTGDSGSRPAHLDPWAKWRLGWITPTAVQCTSTRSLPQAATSSSGFLRLLNGSAPSGTGEYFLAENREFVGFDAGLPGAGLLIWHVDESRTTNSTECYPGGPSCATQHYKVAVVQADNAWQLEKNTSQGDDGDSFPGSAGNTSFTGASSPSSNLYSGASSGISITSISSSQATMTARLQAPGNGNVSIAKAGSGAGSVVSTPVGISCGATCAADFSCGSSVSLAATPDSGSVFAGWSGACSGTGACSVAAEMSTAVTATFAPLTTFVLSVGKSGTGSGTVTSAPAGIDCGATCSAGFASGTTVTLTPTPAAGSTFSGWSGACTGAGTCQVDMTQARAVSASFTRITYGLTVAKSGSGAGVVTSLPSGIDCGSTCSAVFGSGTTVTLTAAPAAGSGFMGWGNGCSGTALTCQVALNAAATVSARFDALRGPAPLRIER